MPNNMDDEKKKVAIELWRGHLEFSWSQVRMIPVLQVAIAAGTWATIKDTPLVSSAILVLGTLILVAVVLMLVRHFQYSEAFKKAAGNYFPKVDKPKIIRSDITIIALASILAVSNVGFAFFTKPISEILRNKETISSESTKNGVGKTCNEEKIPRSPNKAIQPTAKSGG